MRQRDDSSHRFQRMRETRWLLRSSAPSVLSLSRMDKNGNVKISVTGYILSYYSSWSLPRAEFLETARIRCLIISSNTEDTEEDAERARVRLGRIVETGKKGARGAPFRELISHERAKAGRTSGARYAILLNYDSPRRGGTNVSRGRVPAIFLSP